MSLLDDMTHTDDDTNNVAPADTMTVSTPDAEDVFQTENLEEVSETTSENFSLSVPEEPSEPSDEAPGGRAELDDYQAEGMAEGTKVVSKPARRRWYIINTYSGHENKVKINLERRVESMNMGHKIFRVEVPQKAVTKIKDGKRTEKDERLFPGYVLVEMLMDDDSWYVVRYTPGVTKFVGGEKKPSPVRDSEIKRILFKNQQTVARKVEIDIKVGDTIQIISGPFADFEGSVTEVLAEKEKLKASVSIFGRETPVELSFGQIQKRST